MRPRGGAADGNGTSTRLAESLGYRLTGVRRTRSGQVVAVVDRHDEEIQRCAEEAAGEDVVVVDQKGLAALEALDDESPLAGVEPIALPPDAEDQRGRVLGRVAARRFRAAKTLAEAGLGAEAISQARDAWETATCRFPNGSSGKLSRRRRSSWGNGDDRRGMASKRMPQSRMLT